MFQDAIHKLPIFLALWQYDSKDDHPDTYVLRYVNRIAEEDGGSPNWKIGNSIGVIFPGYYEANKGEHANFIEHLERSVKTGEAQKIKDLPYAMGDKLHFYDLHIYLAKDNHIVHLWTDVTEESHYDELTGLPNRRMLIRLYDAPKEGYTVFFLDLDNFKTINDTLGHSAGDKALQMASRKFKGICDEAYRLGGDEFILIFHDIQRPEAENLAQQIIRDFEPPFKINNGDHYLNVSIGIAQHGVDGNTLDELIERADTAMYRAKANGNAYKFYNEALRERDDFRKGIISGLYKAVEENQFVIHYQPQVLLETGDLVGAEALIRWKRDGELVPPGVFIPVAEESGLIVNMGDLIIEQICKDMRIILDEGIRLVMGFNVSAKQFKKDDKLISSIQENLVKYGLEGKHFDVEVTEGVIINNIARVKNILNRIRDIGVRISIDDFGTGYSSLGYLKSFPIDTIKIDKSFVEDIPLSNDDTIITRTIIQMAHNLGMRVVAEGVETQAQVNFLKAERCNIAQGYHYGRPMPLEDFLEKYKNEKY